MAFDILIDKAKYKQRYYMVNKMVLGANANALLLTTAHERKYIDKTIVGVSNGYMREVYEDGSSILNVSWTPLGQMPRTVEIEEWDPENSRLIPLNTKCQRFVYRIKCYFENFKEAWYCLKEADWS